MWGRDWFAGVIHSGGKNSIRSPSRQNMVEDNNNNNNNNENNNKKK